MEMGETTRVRAEVREWVGVVFSVFFMGGRSTS